MKRIPLAAQLSLVLFLVLVIPCVALTMYSGNLITASSQEELAEAFLSELNADSQLTETLLTNMSQEIHQIAAYADFSGLNTLSSYGSIRRNVEGGMKISRIQQELARMTRINSAILSAFFILDGADYVVSSDRGIVLLADYASVNWLDVLSTDSLGIAGTWVPRVMEHASVRELQNGGGSSTVNVVSYVYPLSRLTTATGGTLVINLDEREIIASLNPGKAQDGDGYGTMLLQANGHIVSHLDPLYFLFQARSLPNISAILDSSGSEGYAVYDMNATPCLYAWVRSASIGWVYISVQPISAQQAYSQSVIQKVALFTVAMVLASATLAAVIIMRLFSPMRHLVQNLREISKGRHQEDRNELSFLNSAFQDIREKETELNEILESREKAAFNLALYNMLSGEHLPENELDLIRGTLPYPFYAVAILAIDGYNAYRQANSGEVRNYHLMLISAKSEELLARRYTLRGIKYASDRLALVFNFEAKELGGDVLGPLAGISLEQLKRMAAEILGHSVSVGLSPLVGADSVAQAAVQANGAVTQRMKEGGDKVFRWQQNTPERRYIFPHETEGRILNYLDSGDTAPIRQELENLAVFLRGNAAVSQENIRYIYIQLVSGAIRHLAEKNVNTSTMLNVHGNVYTKVSACDTLDELSSYMESFYRDIITEAGQSAPHEKRHLNNVLQYLRVNYAQDIDFEALAADNGISYSYMRKIVRAATGKSLNDHLNYLRIEQAKAMLRGGGAGLQTVARAVGYHNAQSLTRFFHKLEGYSPGEYRSRYPENS